LEHTRSDDKAKEYCLFVVPHCGLIKRILGRSMDVMNVDDFVLLRKESHLGGRKLLETEMFIQDPCLLSMQLPGCGGQLWGTIAEWFLFGSCRKYGEYERKMFPSGHDCAGICDAGCRHGVGVPIACLWLDADNLFGHSAREFKVEMTTTGADRRRESVKPPSVRASDWRESNSPGNINVSPGVLIPRIPRRIPTCRTSWRQC
jgi:hypothetical protein